MCIPGWGGGGGEGEVLPYMGYISMCGPKGYGFLAFLVINRVSDCSHFDPILVINRILILLSGLKFEDVYSDYLRAATACHALRSRAGLQGFLN